MKIRQWLGYNEDASQYLLRPGELRVLNNLQSRRPGMLITRPGIKKIYGRYDDESIYGIYRRATILGTPSDFIWLQKILVERELSANEISQSVYPFKEMWQVKRILDDSARVVDEFDIAPHGTAIKNFCLAEDRHGRIFIFYGNGLEPRLYRPELLSTSVLPMGLKAPLSKPKINPTGSGFFIEQVDVLLGGGGYNSPPTLTVEGGEPAREAKLKAIVQRGNVVGVDIVDGGSGYKEPPEVKAGMDDVGSGFRAVGHVNSAAQKLIGFDPTIGGIVTGTAPSQTETYGSNDGTENQQIQYSTEERSSTTRLMAWRIYYNGGVNITLGAGVAVNVNSVEGVRVGNLASMTAWTKSTGAYHNRGQAVTVTGVDPLNKTITFNGAPYSSINDAGYYYEINIQNTAGTDTTKRAGIKVASTAGMQVGDSVQFDPDIIDCVPVTSNLLPSVAVGYQNSNLAPINATNPKIAEIDTENDLIFLDQTFVIGKGTGAWRDGSHDVEGIDGNPPKVFNLEVSNNGVATVPATYNKDIRRFFANVPANSSSDGEGAHGTLEFSPLPLGHAVNTSSEDSKGVIDTGLNKHFNIFGSDGGAWITQTTLSEYLYGEYWGGSDFDRPRSAENARYGGLQASGSTFIHGFSGTVGGRKADVYWPDYSKISVWFNTGVRSGSLSQWTRFDVPVQTDGGGSRYIEFDLKPTRNAKKVTNTRGSVNSTEYEDENQLPDAVPPKVRINLVECPDSWLVDGSECVPTANKETGNHGQGNRLPWYSGSSGVPRPVVDLPRNGITNEIETTALGITNPGSGWAKDTEFVIRLYQANAYQQVYDYNTAVTEPTKKRGHSRYSTNDRYVEFRVKADVADVNTPHGPPHTLIEPATIGISGDGYNENEAVGVTLHKRTIGATGTSTGQIIRWTAKSLATLSSPTAKHIDYITIYNKGVNFKSRPEIEISGGGDGYGLKVDPVVKEGRIDKVTILDKGQQYTSAPVLTTVTRPAKLTPVMRPSMRGMYQCAYRFVDRSEQIIKTITAERGESSTHPHNIRR
jgi:hypothetical protein